MEKLNMFDTLRYSESLANAGVPEDQARLQAKVLSGAFESNDLATKADIVDLRSDVKAEISELRSDVKAEISELRSNIVKLDAQMAVNMSETSSQILGMKLEFTRWIIGMFFAITGVMFALLRLMLP